jgi:hypothetical protein
VSGGLDRTAGTLGWPPAAPRFRTRALGRAEDLDIDFRSPRPHIVTQILVRCVGDAAGRRWPAEELWRWTVPQRTQGLLGVGRACGIASVAALARCVLPECSERIELEFELESFARAAEDRPCTWRGDGAEIVLRLPTGEDQRRWLDAPLAHPDELPISIGTSLVCEIDGAAPDATWRLPQVWLAGVEGVLAEHDPTTDLSVNASCPRCGDELEIEVDLELLLLERLARLQQDLLADVHVLAGGYHWSEAQILALPAWRRAYYLQAMRGEA